MNGFLISLLEGTGGKGTRSHIKRNDLPSSLNTNDLRKLISFFHSLPDDDSKSTNCVIESMVGLSGNKPH